MLDTPDLSGGGGTERVFADAFDAYQANPAARYELFAVVDQTSFRHLRDIGRLQNLARVKVLKRSSGLTGRLRHIPYLFGLVATQLQQGFDLLHLVLPKACYLPFVVPLTALPPRFRPRVALNVVDCSLVHVYSSPEVPDHYGAVAAHRPYFDYVHLDGIFTWYEAFRKQRGKFGPRGGPRIVSGPYCLTPPHAPPDLARKTPQFVFAGRLEPAKRPFLFLDAVHIACDRAPEVMQGWSFAMYGRGALEPSVRGYIAGGALADRLTLGYEPVMDGVFAASQVFVSTQDYENYSSLAMLEAMIHGNAIIARAVGETYRFVERGGNGFLVEGEDPAELAEAMIAYARKPEVHASMAQRSWEIAMTHSPDAFLRQLEEFWTGILGRTIRK